MASGPRPARLPAPGRRVRALSPGRRPARAARPFGATTRRASTRCAALLRDGRARPRALRDRERLRVARAAASGPAGRRRGGAGRGGAARRRRGVHPAQGGRGLLRASRAGDAPRRSRGRSRTTRTTRCDAGRRSRWPAWASRCRRSPSRCCSDPGRDWRRRRGARAGRARRRAGMRRDGGVVGRRQPRGAAAETRTASRRGSRSTWPTRASSSRRSRGRAAGRRCRRCCAPRGCASAALRGRRPRRPRGRPRARASLAALEAEPYVTTRPRRGARLARAGGARLVGPASPRRRRPHRRSMVPPGGSRLVVLLSDPHAELAASAEARPTDGVASASSGAAATRGGGARGRARIQARRAGGAARPARVAAGRRGMAVRWPAMVPASRQRSRRRPPRRPRTAVLIDRARSRP